MGGWRNRSLMRKSGGPFVAPPSLAEFAVGGGAPLHSGSLVTIEGHRVRFGSKVIRNGATAHRLVLASRGKSLASYTTLKQLLKAALVIVPGMKFVMALFHWFLIPFPAHKALHDQEILHRALSYGKKSSSNILRTISMDSWRTTSLNDTHFRKILRTS